MVSRGMHTPWTPQTNAAFEQRTSKTKGDTANILRSPIIAQINKNSKKEHELRDARKANLKKCTKNVEKQEQGETNNKKTLVFSMQFIITNPFEVDNGESDDPLWNLIACSQFICFLYPS